MAQEISVEGRLTLTGAITLQSVDTIHSQLLAMADQPVVEIDCSEATEVDVSLIQLILAARSSREKSGRSITLTQPASGALRETLHRGGFITADADPACSDHAFWLQTAARQ